MGDKDVDAQFADIIAHWDDVESLADPTPSDTGLAVPNPPEDSPPEATGHVNESPLMGIPVWRGATAPPPGAPGAEAGPPAEEDEHFEPGPTAPLPPQDDLHFWGIVVGLVGGPLLLLWLVIFPPGLGSWWGLLALGLTVGGFILLVLRQPSSRDDGDPDNGARV